MKKSNRPQRLWPLALFRLKISEIASPETGSNYHFSTQTLFRLKISEIASPETGLEGE